MLSAKRKIGRRTIRQQNEADAGPAHSTPPDGTTHEMLRSIEELATGDVHRSFTATEIIMVFFTYVFSLFICSLRSSSNINFRTLLCSRYVSLKFCVRVLLFTSPLVCSYIKKY